MAAAKAVKRRLSRNIVGSGGGGGAKMASEKKENEK
jgi:hypothetical protein